MILRKKSLLSGNWNEMNLPISAARYIEWCDLQDAGMAPSVQHFFSELSPEQREFMLTGASPEEWTKAFGERE